MGHLLYGRPPERFEIEDRALAHVKVVMLAKLRRNEPFAMTFDHDPAGGRSTIWVHPTIPLQFSFLGSRRPPLNRLWLDALMVSANSMDGLHVGDEPPDVPGGARSTEPHV